MFSKKIVLKKNKMIPRSMNKIMYLFCCEAEKNNKFKCKTKPPYPLDIKWQVRKHKEQTQHLHIKSKRFQMYFIH